MTVSFLTRIISIVAAFAVTVAIVCFPRWIAVDMNTVPHGWLVCLLLGMSAAYVHGFGFVPENRYLFSRRRLAFDAPGCGHDYQQLISSEQPMQLNLRRVNAIR